ncbi:MAG: 30S ribosomal protein S3 [Candidatus Diapherotrites archaeon]|nr:30S ribosomal protein S3 [Candidatus Diapherotrites archaeon]
MLERVFVKEGKTNVHIDEYLGKELNRAGYVGCQVQKTPIATRIVVRVERPGLVIGRKGASIQRLTENLEKVFKLENIQIKVEEVPVPELDPAVMAKRIASSLERGLHYRRVMHWSLEKIMNAGAKGAEIVVRGKLVGKGGKSRSERISAGYLKKAGEPSKLVKEAKSQALKKAGIIGVTVKIVPPNVIFPDKVVITGEEIGSTESQRDKKDEPERTGEKTPGDKG